LLAWSARSVPNRRTATAAPGATSHPVEGFGDRGVRHPQVLGDLTQAVPIRHRRHDSRDAGLVRVLKLTAEVGYLVGDLAEPVHVIHHPTVNRGLQLWGERHPEPNAEPDQSTGAGTLPAAKTEAAPVGQRCQLLIQHEPATHIASIGGVFRGWIDGAGTTLPPSPYRWFVSFPRDETAVSISKPGRRRRGR
jgi:hypothetical protein